MPGRQRETRASLSPLEGRKFYGLFDTAELPSLTPLDYSFINSAFSSRPLPADPFAERSPQVSSRDFCHRRKKHASSIVSGGSLPGSIDRRYPGLPRR